MSHTPLRTTIVIPCYNEAERLQRESFRCVADPDSDFRILFVNDGSTDETQRVLEEIRRAYSSEVEVLTLDSNSGKAEAVRRGMLQAIDAGAEAAGFWDADLSTPLEAVADFQAILATHSHLVGVMGSRIQLLGRHVKRKASRHYIGRVFATAASLTLQTPVYDTQCGAKLFRTNAALRDAFAEPFKTRWIFDVELLVRLGRSAVLAEVLYEYPLHEWTDVPGSKVRIRDGLRAGVDLLRLWGGKP